MSSEVSRPSDVCPSCGHRATGGDKYCSECGFPLATVEAAVAEADTLLGRTLSGGYRIVEFIAEGSMGRVYRAEQANLGRSVAVKIMNAALLAHPKMVDRFHTEAKAASMLNHPNCVRVYDFGETNDKRPYIVMELLHGKDLELLLRDEPLMPVTRVLDIVLQVLGALEEAHDQEIVHRDLKPANIFVLPQRGGGDLVKVVDFGLAKLRSAISGSTMTGIICGTPAYMAPEQATAAETDGRTDLYALGVILFEMLAGRQPFTSDDPTTLLKSHVFEAPPRLVDIAPDRVPQGIEPVLDRMLAKEPKDRYENAAALSAALQEVIAIRMGERSRSWVRTSLRACSECGGLFPTTARFCGECGAPAPRDSLPLVSESALAEAAGAADESAQPSRASSRPPPKPTRQTKAVSSKPPPPIARSESPAPFEDERSAQLPPEAPPPARPATEHRPAAIARRRSRRVPAVTPTEAENGPHGRPRLDTLDDREEPGPRSQRSRYEDTGPREIYRPPTGAAPGTTGPLYRREEEPAPAKEDESSTRRSRSGESEPPGPSSAGVRARRASIPDDTIAATLVHLEQVAVRRTESGDHRGAADAFGRALIHIRNDIDRGELDDPIGAMALFSGKLGEALVAAGEPAEALAPLREAVSLMRAGPERIRLLLVMSRAARESGREEDSIRYLEEAETEAQQRVSVPPPGRGGVPMNSSVPPISAQYGSSAPRVSSSTPPDGRSEGDDDRTSGINLSGRKRTNTPAPSRKRSM